MPDTSDQHDEQIFLIPNVAQRLYFTNDETRSKKGNDCSKSTTSQLKTGDDTLSKSAIPNQCDFSA